MVFLSRARALSSFSEPTLQGCQRGNGDLVNSGFLKAAADFNGRRFRLLSHLQAASALEE